MRVVVLGSVLTVALSGLSLWSCSTSETINGIGGSGGTGTGSTVSSSSEATGTASTGGASGTGTSTSTSTSNGGGGSTSASNGGGGAGGGMGTGAGGSTASAGGGGAGGGCGFCDSTCCNGLCVNTGNDINNCGGCFADGTGEKCNGPDFYCDHGTCGTPPCNASTCTGNDQCCDTQCCAQGELCCTVPGSLGDTTTCMAPDTNGTCPTGCVGCVCASPDTPVATPSGERPIADIREGDLVYSVRGRALVAVPVLQVTKQAAPAHVVVRVTLETGRVLEISPKHPTGDGRKFGELRAGDRLDGVRVERAEFVPYKHGFTHDILPDSDTGTYVAGGVVIGSTLRGD